MDGFTEEEAAPYAEMPPLEQYILHRLSELRGLISKAVETHQWVGVYPALHGFCTTDLSAFYFDIRKDAIYCDAPSDPTRRAARTVLDILHRALCTWLAPVLVFTAEEAWNARFGEESSIHLEQFFEPDAEWNNPELGVNWDEIRAYRRLVTTELETARRDGTIGASLEASVTLPISQEEAASFTGIDWAELLITSHAEIELLPGETAHGGPQVERAPGQKCARCWKVLPDVGENAEHPALCRRCVSVVSA
ncbi:hypothetical protein AD936_05640 [Gluconobacter japonicus]|nr:hypothetical protein AD936_05640 [Gluconobacter japonicus]